MAEREEISRDLVAGRSIRTIAAELGRAPSTVSREIRPNESRRRYRASKAHAAARERAKRPKTCNLVLYSALARELAEKITQLWSPYQMIAGWLKRQYPGDERR